MRKESKTRIDTNKARIQGYHEGGRGNAEAYAFEGFGSGAPLYFASDRAKKLAEIEAPKGYGLEIETTSNTITNSTVLAEVFDKIIFSHFPKNLFKMQRDGSLGGRTSAEVISQVMTKAFIRNQYPAFHAMFEDYFKSFGIGPDETCGMHTNISLALLGTTPEKQAEATRKLYYFINHHFAAACILFHRSADRTGYCDRMRHDKEYCRSMDPSAQYCSHGVAFNMGHYNAGRIELRLVGPQADFWAFRNTMETVFYLVDAVKRLSWDDLDDLRKVFTGCNQYVIKRLRELYRAGYLTAEDMTHLMEHDPGDDFDF